MASITHTVGGTDNLVNFKSAARVPIESLKVHFSPIQEGEGDPSPENVRPISGWDGIEVYHAGKNLLKYWKNGYYSSTRGYFVSVQNNASFYPIKVKSTDVLYFSINSPVGYSAFYFFTDPFNMNNNTYISGEQYHSSAQTGRYVKKIQPPQDCWLVFQIDYGSPRTVENAYEKKPQLEFESFSNGVSLGATDYEPYCGEILPITFPVVGKNKFNGEFTHYNIGSDGTVLASDAKRISSLYIPVSHGTYTLSSNENFPFAIYVYENNNESSYLLDESLINWTNSPATFTINKGQYISIKWKNFENTEINISDISNVQLELGTEATTYEPYNSDNTVYGGYIDLAKGEVVATYFHYILNGTETRWSLDGSGDTSRRTYIDTARFNMIAKAKGKLFSNYCKTSGSSSLWWGWISSTGSSNSCHILFYIPATIDTVDKWKAYLSENPLEIVYELAEPIHYSLTPTQLTTFLNQNNFWSNTNGSTEVSYAIHDSEQIRAARKRILAAAPKVVTASSKGLVNFKTDMKAPLQECKIYFTPEQEGEGDPSPDNIRPISGWDSIEVRQAGKNLLSLDEENWDQGARGYSSESLPGHVKDRITTKKLIIFPPNIIMTTSQANTLQVATGYFEKTKTQRLQESGWKNSTYTKSSPVGTAYYTFNVATNPNGNIITPSYLNSTNWIQFEVGSIATEYEPYQGQNFNINWTDSIGTIYGGYVDLIKGKIVAEWKIADMGDFNYGINTVLTGVDRYDVYITDFKGNNSHDAPDLISELFKSKDIYSANNEYATWVVSTIENHLYFYTPAGTYENQTAFKTAVTGKKIVYKLKTPIEYDIDPSTLKTLHNTNNIWSSANGDIEIKYWTH